MTNAPMLLVLLNFCLERARPRSLEGRPHPPVFQCLGADPGSPAPGPGFRAAGSRKRLHVRSFSRTQGAVEADRKGELLRREGDTHTESSSMKVNEQKVI